MKPSKSAPYVVSPTNADVESHFMFQLTYPLIRTLHINLYRLLYVSADDLTPGLPPAHPLFTWPFQPPTSKTCGSDHPMLLLAKYLELQYVF